MMSQYHDLVSELRESPDAWLKGRQTVYLLNYSGADINQKNEAGETPLHTYLTSPTINLSILEAFLQCNADMYATNDDGRTPLMVGLIHGGFSGNVKDVIMKYAPGLKRAVVNGDLGNVRKLINQGCSVHNILQDDAFRLCGCEAITKLITDIAPSMALLHASMAGDTETACTILTSSQRYNINLRNMGHHGNTALYYALCNNQPDLIDLLLQHSARADICLTVEGDDIPMLMYALSSRIISPSTLQHVFTKLPPSIVHSLTYKGENLLHAALTEQVDPVLFRQILVAGGARLLTHITSDNLSVREMAEKIGNMEFVEIIDEVVQEWCASPTPKHRRDLALRGYRHLPNLAPNVASDVVVEFFARLPDYQERIEIFHTAVEANDLQTVEANVLCAEFSKHFDPCLADSCTMVNGQPALHKATLRGHTEVVRSLGEAIVYLKGEHIDSIRDQFHRTGLHYAMAVEKGEAMVKLLHDLGASENTLDKNGEPPLSFKERKHLPLMKSLLHYHLTQNFTDTEPDPFANPLPPPIISYLNNLKQDPTNRLSVTDRLSALSYHTHGHSHGDPDTHRKLLQLTQGEKRTGDKRTGENQTDVNWTGVNRTETNWTGEKRTGVNRSEANRTETTRTGQNQTEQNRTSENRTSSVTKKTENKPAKGKQNNLTDAPNISSKNNDQLKSNLVKTKQNTATTIEHNIIMNCRKTEKNYSSVEDIDLGKNKEEIRQNVNLENYLDNDFRQKGDNNFDSLGGSNNLENYTNLHAHKKFYDKNNENISEDENDCYNIEQSKKLLTENSDFSSQNDLYLQQVQVDKGEITEESSASETDSDISEINSTQTIWSWCDIL